MVLSNQLIAVIFYMTEMLWKVLVSKGNCQAQELLTW